MAIVSRFWMMSLQAGILILIVLLARMLLKKYPKIYTYCLWALVGLRLLCPVFIETPFSLQPDYTRLSNTVQEQMVPGDMSDMLQGVQEVLPDVVQSEEGVTKTDSIINSFTGTQVGQPENIIGQSGAVQNQEPKKDNIKDAAFSAGTEKQASFDNLLGIIVMIYVVGIGAISVFYLLQYFMIKHRISTAVRDSGNVWLCDNISSPFVIGIIKPRIILPYSLSEKETQHILKHERTHIKHYDPFIRFVGLVCICLHWWNPLVWIAIHKMNQDMEMYCDETALGESTTEERKSYARTLLSFAERQSGFSVGLAFGESNTERRVKNIMNKRKGSIVIVSVIAVLAFFCMVAFMTIPKGNDNNNGTANNESTQETSDDSGRGSNMNNSEETTGEGVEQTTGNGEEQPTEQIPNEPQSINAQLELIADNIEKLQLFHEWVDAVNRYAVTDLDQNGRLELIASNMGGTGAYTYSRFYEVNETYDELVEYDIGFDEGHSQPDIIVENVDMYYDATGNIFYYIERDTIKESTTEYHSFLYSMSLSDGKLVTAPLSDMIETYYDNYRVIYKDSTGKEITKAEYDVLVANAFKGCDKYGANFGWQDTRELAKVTDRETIVKELSRSYDRFRFYINYEEGMGRNNLTDNVAYSAYAKVLENLYYKHEFADGENVGIQPEDADVSLNRFAVVDIDSDGRDELVVEYTTTYTAGQTIKVYDYDSVSDVVREQFSEYPAVTFYSNGWILAQWSHNHGRAPMLEGFWPYRIYNYDSLEDEYDGISTVDAWDEEYYNQDNSFPKEADFDGDGILYYAMSFENPEYITPWDAKEYNHWLTVCLEDAEKIEVPYMNMTLENIESIKR
ncbi:MAG: hypothetical protein E7261_12815 [Lachnospiraceae bacterium]|nr:hypothetical protein [Lachnospiraceae bacterium]